MLDNSTWIADHFFSIDDILATQEKVPCKFEVSVFRLGFLDTSTDSENIQPGAKLELPYWLARALCNQQRTIVSVEATKPYRSGFREIMKADANVMDLYKLGPYYYAFGSKLLNFELPEADDIAKSLLQTFTSRFRGIMDSAQNALNEDTSALVAKLDESERALFRAGQASLQDQQLWETRQMEKITVSNMVMNYRKRKRIEMESS